MRRNLELTEQTELLSNNYIGHLGYNLGGTPHVLPITYYFDEGSNSIISYSGEGHKITAMRKNPTVALVVDEIESIHNWKSVLVHGTFEEIQGIDAKHYLHMFSDGVKSILNRTVELKARFISEFSSKIHADGHPVVFRINIDEITGKLRQSQF